MWDPQVFINIRALIDMWVVMGQSELVISFFLPVATETVGQTETGIQFLGLLECMLSSY